MKKICIVTDRHISYNPRVLKEADALYAAGYEVSVVTVSNHLRQRSFDKELMQSRRWKLKTVNFCKEAEGEKVRWLFLSVKKKLFTLLSRITPGSGIAERAAERAFDELRGLAKSEKADLYLVHHPEMLGVGFAASKANRARLGFDAEDFHTGMTEEGSAEERLIDYIERKYLPRCDYLTAASKGIADAYRDKYGLKEPRVILNVFPLEDLPGGEVHTPVKFYWYSQIIGPGRGLEVLVEAAGLIASPFEIHLRGDMHSTGYFETLNGLAEKFNVKDRIYFHEPILAGNIVKDSGNFDVGLALENDRPFNRNICVTNKVLSYLMSGLAIVGTATFGQKDIFGYFAGAGRLFPVNGVAGLAEAMRSYIDDPAGLQAAKKASRKAAVDHFNWDLESRKLLAYIGEALGKNH